MSKTANTNDDAIFYAVARASDTKVANLLRELLAMKPTRRPHDRMSSHRPGPYEARYQK